MDPGHRIGSRKDTRIQQLPLLRNTPPSHIHPSTAPLLPCSTLPHPIAASFYLIPPLPALSHPTPTPSCLPHFLTCLCVTWRILAAFPPALGSFRLCFRTVFHDYCKTVSNADYLDWGRESAARVDLAAMVCTGSYPSGISLPVPFLFSGTDLRTLIVEQEACGGEIFPLLCPPQLDIVHP